MTGVHILHVDRAPHADAGAQVHCGVLAFEVRGAQLHLYGISGAADEQSIVSTLPVSQAMDQKKFNHAACKALAGLPVLAEP